ncbi:MAG: 6-phosphofructokinase [Candidatus Omnitrophica bacterium]|nr:6-phosphofructokinase [Candidatus Omnitrophota bacterium]
MRKIGVLTSGGDAPGMNAAIRSVVRKATREGVEVLGILRGYEGLINGETMPLNSRSVSNIIGRGGTILKTARSKEFETRAGQEKAVKTIKENGIDGLVVIGGNGSFQGANILDKEWGIRNVGVPGTIDNDLGYTDYTVGCSTSVDTVLDAIDKIRDTVSSMERIYVIEVMGRQEPYIAVMSGLAGGAEEVLFPGMEIDYAKLTKEITEARARGKRSWIIVVSEGAGSAIVISEEIGRLTGLDVRPIVLGHIQRGGSPDASDRVLATCMGGYAVAALLKGHSGVTVSIQRRELVLVPYEKACFERDKDRKLHAELYRIIKELS